jgi:pilus assembly protein CpaE
MTNLPGITSVSIILVCVEADGAESVRQGLDRMPWVVTSSSFDAYVSNTRRPYFGPQMKQCDAIVAFVDFDVDPDQAVETTKYLQQIFPGKLSVVALSSSLEPELLLQAMRAGCTEFLNKPISPVALFETLERMEHSWAQATTRAAAPGSLLSFFGSKGGVGTTTLAVHLAMYLVQCHQKKVLLIDNRPELGHVCVYLGIDGSRFPFHEVVRNVARLDSELLQASVAKHPSGLHVLASPDICGGMKVLDAEMVSRTLEFLRTEYDFVIVDSATRLDPVNLAVIDASARVYLVATPEVGSIRDLSRYVDNLMQIEYTTEKMHVVINRFSSRYAVNVEQIEKAIRLPVAIKLPNNFIELVRSVNLGEPVSPKLKSEFALQMTQWAASVVGANIKPAQVPKSKSIFAMW